MNTDRPKMLTQADADALLRKPGFFDRMPEYRDLQKQLVAAPKPAVGGCRGCARRREQRNLFTFFLGVTTKLPEEAMARLKQELGVTSLMYYGYSPSTGRYEMRRA